MEEAEHCDRLAILSEGKLVALGSPFELKSEIGGDIVSFETANETDAVALAKKIANRFIISPSVLGNTVRLERELGHKFVTEVVEAFPGMVEGISVAKPSLEDVFIQRTGHRFWTEPDTGVQDTKAKERG
jgi:ABC-2 type transport system ATP-binding protein